MSEGSKQQLKMASKSLPNMWAALTNSKNLQLLRQQQAKYLSPEANTYKELLQSSIFVLLGNVLGLSWINFQRGFDAKAHEMTHKWSRPVHLFFLGASLINIAATCYFGHQYTTHSSQQVRNIFQLASDPRIYLDIDKLQKNQQNGKDFTVIKGTFKQRMDTQNESKKE